MQESPPESPDVLQTSTLPSRPTALPGLSLCKVIPSHSGRDRGRDKGQMCLEALTHGLLPITLLSHRLLSTTTPGASEFPGCLCCNSSCAPGSSSSPMPPKGEVSAGREGKDGATRGSLSSPSKTKRESAGRMCLKK